MPTPVSSFGSYASTTVSPLDDDRFARVNQLGLAGYALLTQWLVNSRGVLEDVFLFGKDSSFPDAKYQYKGNPLVSRESTLQLINDQGAIGYAYKGIGRYLVENSASTAGFVFARDVSRTESYAYETQPSGSPIGKEVFASQLSAQGARGFQFLGPFGFDPAGVANIFGKVMGSSITYEYVMEAGDFTGIDDMAQRLNAHGARGLVYRGLYAVDNAQTFVQLYEKSSAQLLPIQYRVEVPRSNIEGRDPVAYVDPTFFVFAVSGQANDLGALGYFYLPIASRSRINGQIYAKDIAGGAYKILRLPE